MKPFGPWLVCWEFFDSCINFITYYWSIQVFWFSWMTFGRLYVSRNVSILPMLCVLWAYECWWFCLRTLYVSVTSVVTLLFSFLIWCTGPLCFLMRLAIGSSILFIFLKNQLLLSLIFCFVFFGLSVICFCSDFDYFLPLTHGFSCCSFPSSSKCWVRLFIWHFSCFFR